MPTPDLPVERLADVSAAHLSPNDRALLERYIETGGADGLSCLVGPYGWLIYASSEPQAAEHASPGLAAILYAARAQDCAYVLFDRDGLQIDGIQTYDGQKI
ncbi:hypothetical protein GOB83_13225 [Acetobacter fabarum]|uniref:DUF5983 family protein n=1 Tax=Acetobacter fabarum TaxID=483199 RepID=UPI0014046D2B|nr:hypothetical protein [Acetobacter fabarum]NHO43122.1 hypothetical protein [Acetobacter fabarum]